MELDTRHDGGYTVALEWDQEPGTTQVVIDDIRAASQLTFPVANVNAGDAFRHPFRYTPRAPTNFMALRHEPPNQALTRLIASCPKPLVTPTPRPRVEATHGWVLTAQMTVAAWPGPHWLNVWALASGRPPHQLAGDQINRRPHMAVITHCPSPTSEDPVIVESSFSATINAPIEKVDIPAWCFSLPDSEYQACSPAHVAAGATTASDGRRMSINVEIIGGSLMVQHYVEEISEPDHLRLVSRSDLFTPSGRTQIDVIWDLRARRIDDATCEFTNAVRSSAPLEMQEFLAHQGLAFDPFRAARAPNSEAHNRQETPEYAHSIERHALARR